MWMKAAAWAQPTENNNGKCKTQYEKESQITYVK